MRISAERQSHLAHQVLDALFRERLLEIPSRADALQALKEAFARLVAVEDAIDSVVRDKLQRQKKIPGSREWQVLYDKYFLEERSKRSW